MNKLDFKKYSDQLIGAGWEKVLSVMSDGGGLAYGTLWLKDGKKYYLNKDTVSRTIHADEMAIACIPIFN